MIYKFKQDDQAVILEVELINDQAPVDMVQLTIMAEHGSNCVYLYKEDVYKLIGALHLLHKEMK